MRTYKRASRVKHLLQQEISRILQMEIKDPRVNLVTVTGIKLTDDLREAKVFVSSLDATVERQHLLTALKRATGYIRGELGRQLTLKHIPTIDFVFDDTYDQQERLLHLLDQLHTEESADEA